MTAFVVDENHIAKAILDAGKINHTVANRAHGGARRRRVVNAQVGAPSLQNRVKTHLEAAAHARKFHRRGQVRFAQALAVEGVVRAFGGLHARVHGAGGDGRGHLRWVVEPHGLKSLAVVDELGAQHLASFDGFAVGFQGFVKHAEAVAFAKAALEVDVTGKNVGDLGRHGVWNIRVVSGCEQRAFDAAAGHAG